MRCCLAATSRETHAPTFSLGGDSDPLACINVGIAQALYGVPASIEAQARSRLEDGLLAVIDRVYQTIGRRP